MYISSVRIENYRAISSLQLSFTDSSHKSRPVSVIVGPNGCGKTSILFGITQALRGILGFQTKDVPDPTRDDIRLPVTTPTGWTDKPPESKVEVELQFSDEEQEIIPDVMRRLRKEPPPALPGGRLTVTWRYPPGFERDGARRDLWYADISPSLTHVSSWLLAKAWAIRASRELGQDIVAQVGGFEFFPQDRNLLLRVVGEADRGVLPEQTLNELDQNETTDRPGRHDRPISDILESLADYAVSHPELPDEWNREKQVQQIFDLVCSPKKYLGVKYRDGIASPVFQDGQHLYPLGNAASGEQVILEYITRLVNRGQIQRSIILIDEPEIHLHPKWIRQLYMALPQIGHQNQFILTTHSDELRRRASADNSIIELGSLGAE
jgi:energy-coupling factor transporter ATP-binding protein EcfA2